MTYFSDGNIIYEGNWNKDDKSGEGFLINPKEKTITEGWWRQGKIEGKTTVSKLKNLG